MALDWTNTAIMGRFVPKVKFRFFMTQSIGSRLLSERERKGLSQARMCEITGVSRKTQFTYETGARLPDASYLAAIEAAGLDLLYIVTGRRTNGSINDALLQDVLRRVEEAVGTAKPEMTVEVKARLISLIYLTASESGRVDPEVLSKAVQLIT
jgi:transcriptional regulator with XRE-family HTH domain